MLVSCRLSRPYNRQGLPPRAIPFALHPVHHPLRHHPRRTLACGAQPFACFGVFTDEAARLACQTPLHKLPDALEQLGRPLEPQAYVAQVAAAGLASLAVASYQLRPRGWVRRELVEARQSSVHGKGEPEGTRARALSRRGGTGRQRADGT